MKPKISFTFDDGLASVLNAQRVLEKFEKVGTVYVVTNWIGRKNYLTAREIKSLAASGWEIGSHGSSHRAMKACTESEAIAELSNSKQVLDALLSSLDTKVSGFCFPYGGPDAVTDRDFKLASNFYSYARLNANRSGGLLPHLVEGTVNFEPICPYTLLGRNPYFGGLRDFRLNISKAISATGWFIFYTHGLSDSTAPSLSEFKKMVEECCILQETGQIEVVTAVEALSEIRNVGIENLASSPRNFEAFLNWREIRSPSFFSKASGKLFRVLRIANSMN